MFFRIWSENLRYEKRMEYHAYSAERAMLYVKALLAAGYKKA